MNESHWTWHVFWTNQVAPSPAITMLLHCCSLSPASHTSVDPSQLLNIRKNSFQPSFFSGIWRKKGNKILPTEYYASTGFLLCRCTFLLSCLSFLSSQHPENIYIYIFFKVVGLQHLTLKQLQSRCLPKFVPRASSPKSPGGGAVSVRPHDTTL